MLKLILFIVIFLGLSFLAYKNKNKIKDWVVSLKDNFFKKTNK